MTSQLNSFAFGLSLAAGIVLGLGIWGSLF